MLMKVHNNYNKIWKIPINLDLTFLKSTNYKTNNRIFMLKTKVNIQLSNYKII